MVIGDEVDEQLLPFHEFECTGIEEYIETLDYTEEAQGHYEKYGDSYETFLDYLKADGYPLVRPGEGIDIEGPHQYSYVLLNEAGEVEKVVRRTNPNARWDWYVVGGRWTGMLQMKAGAVGKVGSPGLFTEEVPAGAPRADSAKKGDVDWEEMRRTAAADAASTYDRVRAVLDEHPKVSSWADYLADVDAGELTIDEAREEYRRQPGVQALSDAMRNDRSFPWVQAEDFSISREKYLEQARDGACATYALVKESIWYEKGKMGWWGISTGEMDQADWNRFINKTIDELDDDTLITIVDCHI